LCEGTGRVSQIVASAYFAVHPEAKRAVTAEMPVGEEDDEEKSAG
jgi:hypothetical protein